MLKSFSKAEKGWIMYDWANSAFAAIVMAIILPIYFHAKADPFGAGPWWGYAVSIGTLVSAVLSPILGTLGDYKGMKMKLFTGFMLLGAVATAFLAAAQQWQAIVILYIVGTIGFNASNVFYDGFLHDVTSDDRMDVVSSYGYGLGYIGGSTIPLIAALGLILFADKIGITSDAACQISFLITAVWWVVFTIPMWKHVKQKHFVEKEGGIAAHAFKRMGAVGRKILKNRPLLLFLLAYFFYIDGVGTIIHMATIFGKNMGMNDIHMVVILMVVQLVAFPCAILYGRLSKKYGARTMILTGIVTYIVICFVALGLEPLRTLGGSWMLVGFIVLGALVGTAQGGIQALSRSFFGKLLPPQNANEYFGFYDIFGKFSAVVGPFLFSLVWDTTEKVYLGIIPVLCMFLIGGALFMMVPKDIKKITAAEE